MTKLWAHIFPFVFDLFHTILSVEYFSGKFSNANVYLFGLTHGRTRTQMYSILFEYIVGQPFPTISSVCRVLCDFYWKDTFVYAAEAIRLLLWWSHHIRIRMRFSLVRCISCLDQCPGAHPKWDGKTFRIVHEIAVRMELVKYHPMRCGKHLVHSS